MLYQTDHSFSSTHNLQFLSHLSTPLLSSQIEFEMECVQGPLMGSLGKEMSLIEDLLNVNGQNVVGSVDDFSVDDLLDFSVMGCDENDETEVLKTECLKTEQIVEENQSICNFGFEDDFGSNELTVPVDEVANLEWLSHFVEDSFSEYSVPFPVEILGERLKNSPEKLVKVPVPVIPCFPTPVPAKARTKRNRNGGRGGWLSGSTTESSSPSSSSSSSNSSPITPPWFIYTTSKRFIDSVNKPLLHKPKRRNVSETSGPPRRCSHCGMQKTPQWRTGPLGAKTLCNACGVRFKSGRLLPEYRPACSPSFSSEVHSNNHRKVLEMRKKKEPVSSESGLASAVVSF